MPNNTCTSGQMSCTFGTSPASFTATPKTVKTGNQDAGNIMDFVPLMNIPPFGQCSSVANPVVASATAAALGVLTPMPCVPATVAPWTPGSPTVIVTGFPALNNTSKLMCLWAGVISFTKPGQTTHNIP